MWEKLQDIASVLTGRGQMNIYRRVLRITLIGSLATFFIMGLLAFYAMFRIRDTLETQGDIMEEEAAAHIAETTEEHIRRRLMETTQVRAQLINRELENVAMDAEFLANELTDVLKNPGIRVPRRLPNASFEPVPENTPYIHYSPDLLQRGVDEALEEEIGLTSSMAETLKNLNIYYDTVVIGSKDGFIVRIDEIPGLKQPVPLSSEPMRSAYDARERGWYKAGKDATKAVFTDMYVSATSGELCVTAVMPYHDAEGFAGVVGVDCNPREIYDQVSASDVGETEFSFVLGSNGDILFSTQKSGVFAPGQARKDLRKSGEESLATAARRMTEGQAGIALVEAEGEKYYLAFTPMKIIGWSFGSVARASEVTGPVEFARAYYDETFDEFRSRLDGFFFRLTTAALALLALLFAVIVYGSMNEAGRFVRPIHALSDGVREISGGNLEKKLEVRTGDEIEELAESFNSMTSELSEYMKNLARTTAENERIATELSVATSIQAGMLPRDFPDRREFGLYATMSPAKEVGGDFYDFYMADEDRLVVTIADVSGKGVPAALFMVVAKTLLKDDVLMLRAAETAEALSEAAAQANDRLTKGNEKNMFVTVFMGVLDLPSGEFTYINAGHNSPLLRRDGKFSFLPKAKSTVLGVLEEMDYPTSKLRLAGGDALFLYTDGVTEAMNGQGELFTEGCLQAALEDTAADADAETMLDAVREAVRLHVGDAEPSDDITMLGLVYHGPA